MWKSCLLPRPEIFNLWHAGTCDHVLAWPSFCSFYFFDLKLRHRVRQGIVLELFLLLAISCIRCEHLKRSSLPGCNEHFIFAHCSKGNRRANGARPAYSWAVPRLEVLGLNGFDFVAKVHERLRYPHYFIPALTSMRCRMTARLWRPQPMSYRQLVTMIRHVLRMVGTP